MNCLLLTVILSNKIRVIFYYIDV